MDKRQRTGAERRNDERLKKIIRDTMQSLIDSQTVSLEIYTQLHLNNPHPFTHGMIKECEQRIAFLKWVQFMHQDENANGVKGSGAPNA